MISAVNAFSQKIILDRYSKRFGYAIEDFMSVFVVSTNVTIRRSHVFDIFKKQFEELKAEFEQNPVYFGNLGWSNFANLIYQATYGLDEKCYFKSDKMLAHDLLSAAEKVNTSWRKIPEAYKIKLDQNGIIFAVSKNIMCIDVINGIMCANSPVMMSSSVKHQNGNRLKPSKPKL